jgi:hypothetical protein
MFIKGLISGRFGHKYRYLEKGTVHFRFGYITRWDTKSISPPFWNNFSHHFKP